MHPVMFWMKKWMGCLKQRASWGKVLEFAGKLMRYYHPTSSDEGGKALWCYHVSAVLTVTPGATPKSLRHEAQPARLKFKERVCSLTQDGGFSVFYCSTRCKHWDTCSCWGKSLSGARQKLRNSYAIRLHNAHFAMPACKETHKGAWQAFWLQWRVFQVQCLGKRTEKCIKISASHWRRNWAWTLLACTIEIFWKV